MHWLYVTTESITYVFFMIAPYDFIHVIDITPHKKCHNLYIIYAGFK